MRVDGETNRGHWLILGFYFFVVGALVLLWLDPAYRPLIEPDNLSQQGRALLANRFGVVQVLAIYILAVAIGLPTSVMVTVGVLIFGPWPGMPFAWLGMVLGSILVYTVGRYSASAFVARRMQQAHKRAINMSTISQLFQQRGVSAVFLLRLLPVAPFIVIGLAAGAFRIRFVDYVLGTAFGLLPITIAVGLFLDRLREAVQHPSWGAWLGLLLLLTGLAWGIRWLKGHLSKANASGNPRHKAN
jgi:phospholipase D1/2